MTRDSVKILKDGFATLERGQDNGRDPSLIARNQVDLAVNATFRGGFAQNRPGVSRLDLEFGNTVAARFTDGRWQGAKYFKPNSGIDERIVCSIGGRQFVFIPDQRGGSHNTIQEITPNLGDEVNADVNNSYRWGVWMEQAEDFLIIQDGQSKAIIYNGSTARRAANDEVPTGTVMAYGLGRLWVARGREFIASDIVGGPSGTSLYNKRDAVLHFTENDYIAEGGAFLAPAEVTAMAFPTNLDTSLGEGELIVFHNGGAVTIRVPANRDEWKNLSIPLQRVSLEPFGAAGQNSVTKVNGDLWFRAKDGLRSFIMAQRQFGEWGNVPMSKEMGAILDTEDETLLPSVSGVLFDNRLLMTCIGQRNFDRGNYFLGLVALDFDLVSSIAERFPPAYDGIWTGLKILQIIVGEFGGVTRCFAFVLTTGDQQIEVWEITKSDIIDRPNSQTEARIEWKVRKRFNFEDNGDGLKRLAAGRLWLDKIRGDLTICVEYRPDQYPIFTEWGDCITIQAKKQWCAGDDCLPRIPMPQYRTQIRLPQLLSPADELTDRKPMNQGYSFDVQFTFQGAAQFRRFRVKSEAVEEDQDWAATVGDAVDIVLTGCPDSFLGYDSSIPSQTLLTAESGEILTTEGGASLII